MDGRSIWRNTLSPILASAGLVTAIASLGAQERPLPAPAVLLANVRPHLRSDRALLSQYTYLEKEREVRITKLGKVELGKEQVFQVYPSLAAGEAYRRLISVAGAPRDPSELAKEDLKRQRQVLDELDQRKREGPAERERRVQRDAEAKREEAERVDDVFRVYDFTLVERRALDGRSTILVDFSPRANAAPKTSAGKTMKKAKGRAWISEDDYEIARVEVEILDDISIGLVLGKLYKGTTAAFTRRKVNDEIWLPAQMRFNGTGRALVRKFRLDTVVEYSDYRKFSVDTDTTFATPH